MLVGLGPRFGGWKGEWMGVKPGPVLQLILVIVREQSRLPTIRKVVAVQNIFQLLTFFFVVAVQNIFQTFE